MHFSIIIPAKNEEANIGRCLDSILSVEWDPAQYEIIVVDNGSADATVEIARAKGATVYVQRGLTVAGLRNFGARKARGTMLAFLDADCGVSRSWLKEAAKYLDREEIVCFGSPPLVPESATWVQLAWYLVRKKRQPVGETAWLESMNMFVRREAFAKCHGFDESLVTCEDYDISLRLRLLGMVYTDAALVATHYGEARDLSQFFRKERWRGISNLAGTLRHGLKADELPSVCLPVLHCLLLLLLVVSPALAFIYGPWTALWVVMLFAAWQSVLLSLSFTRYYSGMPLQVVQVFWLLNVYYVARGVALVR